MKRHESKLMVWVFVSVSVLALGAWSCGDGGKTTTGNGNNCGNGICDGNYGENCSTCADDCGCTDGKACLNGICVKQGSPEIKSFRSIADVFGGKYPVYMAHLFGKQINGSAIHSVHFSLTSTSDQPEDVMVTTELQGYSSPSTNSFHLAPNQTVNGTADPTLDWTRLCGISSSVNSSIDIKIYKCINCIS